jgi:hypothetical protein
MKSHAATGSERRSKPNPGVAPGRVHSGTPMPRPTSGEERRALLLGSLYALGHASVVILLGLLALTFGAVLPAWVDPIMARVVGVTQLLLGIWVFVSLYQYARHGMPFRLRSRWMLVFDSVRYAWRSFQARLHGHTLVGERRYVFGPDALRTIEFDRQALHAWKLKLRHPADSTPLEFEAPMPKDFAGLLRGLRKSSRQ